MSKTEIKKQAQDELMRAMCTAFYKLNDGHIDTDRPWALRIEMIYQFRRVEKFLGYLPGSWKY